MARRRKARSVDHMNQPFSCQQHKPSCNHFQPLPSRSAELRRAINATRPKDPYQCVPKRRRHQK
ncbi:hypothetical protein B0T16DRAFT_406718 [Cercophora newfieldiana]|uniref:Uncharacterized protein n=1 Tax=Cercophora newfieldiana TaxID=92897 RepID=A0AA39YJN5_9PEZI|nr:hypothetical protein B0T16DRAFT_406718 [Cercophora newfieldiana]